jgi:hypothetical protein
VREFHHYVDLVIYASGALTAVIVLVTRLIWRRKKPLQEP